MRANDGPGDPLTDFHTFAFPHATRTCTALPLPSDLVTANGKRKRQTANIELRTLPHRGWAPPGLRAAGTLCRQGADRDTVSSQLETAQQAALFPQSTSNSQSTHNCRRGCSVLASSHEQWTYLVRDCETVRLLQPIIFIWYGDLWFQNMAPRLLAWLRFNLNLVGFFREVTVIESDFDNGPWLFLGALQNWSVIFVLLC